MRPATDFLRSFLLSLAFLLSATCFAQLKSKQQWNKEGNGYYMLDGSSIVLVTFPDHNKTVIASALQLTPKGTLNPIDVEDFSFSPSLSKLLIYTNSQKVWRYKTRGDYWVFDMGSGSLKQLGVSLPESSLMFAKFSPDERKAAYVSEHNIYVEDLASHGIKPLTRDGSRQLINGTFDWVYEEEFDCRDGFRWSPDSRQIAYWQINNYSTRDYLMINNTDSVYSHVVPVEYPVAGQLPSPYRIGVVDINNDQTQWMQIPSDPHFGSYVPRMEWAYNNNTLIIQHLNRKQNQSDIMLCNVQNGVTKTIYTERDSTWIDLISQWHEDYQMGGWDWFKDGNEFLWANEKDGWRHLYRISRDGKKEALITRGNYDVIDIVLVNEKKNLLYFIASPDNATQRYLYRCRLDGKGNPERVTPFNQPGTHKYEISPNGLFAIHDFSNYYTAPVSEWISLPDHKPVGDSVVNKALAESDKSASPLEFLTVKTADGVSMDGWMVKPENFDKTKKYPVLFEVYTEAGAQTALDVYGAGRNPIYKGNLGKDGYIYMTFDNRGTPAPKGSAWRKASYRRIGQVNIHDQAMCAKEILKWPFVDSSRIAVWGWSGGGSATLNLLFQYPGIYKTGIAVAALTNLLTYDNIYEERYMGLPDESMEDYIKGSPLTYVKQYRGNLLYIHGTGDDNVHYNNAEMLLNEMIRYDKLFQFMPYPNRTHAIYEGPGTREQLASLFTAYLNEHCPGGGK